MRHGDEQVGDGGLGSGNLREVTLELFEDAWVNLDGLSTLMPLHVERTIAWGPGTLAVHEWKVPECR